MKRTRTLPPVKIKRQQSGVCQYCGCTDEKGCILFYEAADDLGEPTPIPVTCTWFNLAQTVCNKASCVEAFLLQSAGRRSR